LFVTIACGACSGFHGLVCSGTTSKQVAKESDCKPVGYGAMLLEGLVALIALATVMFVADSDVAGRGPGRIYGDGLGRFVAVLIGDEHQTLAATFGAMAFSTFVFDTLDVATRLGRYILQELFRAPSRAAGLAGTLVTAGLPAVLIVSAAPAPGQPPTYMLFWTLFGTANQLLAALTMLGISVWLHLSGKRSWFVVAPMVFVLAITCWSLVMQAVAGFSGPIGLTAPTLNGVVAVVLLSLALYLVQAAARRVWQAPARGPATWENA
jgi:carbon starvation protein